MAFYTDAQAPGVVTDIPLKYLEEHVDATDFDAVRMNHNRSVGRGRPRVGRQYVRKFRGTSYYKLNSDLRRLHAQPLGLPLQGLEHPRRRPLRSARVQLVALVECIRIRTKYRGRRID